MGTRDHKSRDSLPGDLAFDQQLDAAKMAGDAGSLSPAELAAVEAKIQSVLKTDDATMHLLKEKRAIIRAKKLFEATNQVPSPSKDFCQLLVTQKGVVWRRWKITLRNISVRAPSPSEYVMSYEDFLEDKSLVAELETIFGVETVEHVKRIIEGSNDILSCLSEQLVIRIASFLDLQSVNHLSQVNRRLREVCNSDGMWETLYCTHQGKPSPAIRALAFELGWKVVFFMNKLQLQKELSRRRRAHIPEGDKAEQQTFAPVTPQVED